VRQTVNLLAAFLFVLSIAAGCASHTKTVRTQTVQYPTETVGHSEPVVVEKQTTTTTEARDESGGLLSGSIHAMGEILALPFRLTGGLIKLIF